jgi:hypothetical protein
MADEKKISDLTQASSAGDLDEFVVVNKAVTEGQDASASGQTSKITFGDLKNAVGTQGATGPMGSKGEPGAGAKGEPGTNGAKGPAGPAGPGGATGAKGNMGATGPAGATGATGAKGATGANGQKGATGATGGTGQKGATGATGSTGIQGSAAADHIAAWVKFDNAAVIHGQFNVSSVTDLGVGHYSTNYASSVTNNTAISVSSNYQHNGNWNSNDHISSHSSGVCVTQHTIDTTNTNTDPRRVYIITTK